MGSFSIWHWLIVLVVVLLIFGTKKLKNVGSDLGQRGQGLQGWRQGWHGASADAPTPPAAAGGRPTRALPTRTPSTSRPGRSAPDACAAQPARRVTLAGRLVALLLTPHDRLWIRQDRPDRGRGAHRHRPRETAARGAHRGPFGGQGAAVCGSDVKAEVNRSDRAGRTAEDEVAVRDCRLAMSSRPCTAR